MRTYEPPTLHRAGSFADLTGFGTPGSGDPLVTILKVGG
jgi:hypothetical protein